MMIIKINRWLEKCQLLRTLKILSPTALLLAIVTLWFDMEGRAREREAEKIERDRDRAVRQATLFSNIEKLKRRSNENQFPNIPLKTALELVVKEGFSLNQFIATDQNLKGINLSAGDFRGSTFSGSLMMMSNFENADFSPYIQQSINYRGEQGSSSTLTIFHRANLSSSNLTQVNLSQAFLKEGIFIGTNFSNAKLTKANMEKSELANAFFNKADLTGANLNDANISGANFENVQGLTYQQIKSAWAWDNQPALLPKGFPSPKLCSPELAEQYANEKRRIGLPKGC